jgi:hypothetical protein
LSFRNEEQSRPDEQVATGSERARGRPFRTSPLLALLAVLVLVLLAVAAILLWRSFGESISGTSVARDSIDSGREPQVEITNGPGTVSVEGTGNSQTVEYEVTRYAVAGDPAAARSAAAEVPVDVSREGSTVTLQTDGGGGVGADYAVRMPASGDVRVEAEEGDVEVSGLDGDVTVLAESGDVAVRDVTGDVTVESEEGDVEISGMRTDTGNLELTVGSGDALLRDLILGTLETSVEAGDVRLSGRFSGGGRVSVGTGDVTVDLSSGDATALDLETVVGKVSREPAEVRQGDEQEGN